MHARPPPTSSETGRAASTAIVPSSDNGVVHERSSAIDRVSADRSCRSRCPHPRAAGSPRPSAARDERIGMGVAAVQIAVMARVENEVIAACGPRHVVPGVGERRRTPVAMARTSLSRAQRIAAATRTTSSGVSLTASDGSSRIAAAAASVSRQSQAARPHIGNSCPPSSSPSERQAAAGRRRARAGSPPAARTRRVSADARCDRRRRAPPSAASR